MVFPFRTRQRRADDARAHVNVFAPKRLPDDPGVHQHIAARGFLIELGAVEIDGQLQVPREFLFGRMSSLADDEAERVEVFFLEPLQFAHQHVPWMHEAKQVPVALYFDGAAAPVDGAFECQRIANLDVELGGLFLSPPLLLHELEQEVVRRFITKDVNISAEELGIDEELQRNGTVNIDLEPRLWR